MKRNLKTTILLLLIFCILFNSYAFAETLEGDYDEPTHIALQIDNTDYMIFHGQPMIRPLDSSDSSVKPFIHEGRTMLPMRAISEILNFDGPFYYGVEWFGSEEKAILYLRDASDPSYYEPIADFWIGSTTATFYDFDGNPSSVEIPGAPMIVNSRTYLPLRAVSEAIGINIEWVPSKQGVVLYFWDRPQNVFFPDKSRIAF